MKIKNGTMAQRLNGCIEKNGILFYPVIPGNENESWKRFLDEGFEKFMKGTFAGDYQNNLKILFRFYPSVSICGRN